MTEALARLGQAETSAALKPSLPPIRRDPARLIFTLDLTSSREHSLQPARIAIAGMFDAIKSFGAAFVKMVYYRGANECQASAWHADPEILIQSMRLGCEAGVTQIARVLRLALLEPEKISGVVLVGDHCEEISGELMDLAKSLGQRARPLYIFHECADHDLRSLRAKPLFKGMAEISGGVYVEFKPECGSVLRELLSSVAAFSAAGIEGVKQVGPAPTPQARQLRNRLLLAAPKPQSGECGLLAHGSNGGKKDGKQKEITKDNL